MIEIARHSPSSLNLYCADKAMFVLERVLGQRQPVGIPAHRGVAVEDGVTYGLLNRMADPAEAVEVARQKYATLSALSGDPRREKYAADIPAMVLRALTELRPYGPPSKTQGFVEWKPEGLKLPIVGYYDFFWEDHGIVVDLKTTEKLPSKIKNSHARQCAFYAMSDNYDARLTYVTPLKSATYQLENIREHRNALHRIALTVERFLALSDDPQELKGLVCPDLDSYFWTPPQARQMAYEVWKI